MAATHPTTRRFRALALVAGLVVSACQPGPSPLPTTAATLRATPPPTLAPSPTAQPQTGGTIYLLVENEQLDQIDPQRIYASEDLAFFGATIYRSLESYGYSPDPVAGATLTPDLATDLGRPSDGGRTWSFTMRDGITFQDGSAIRCEDVAYGVSRTFATDVINQGPLYAMLDLDIPTTKEGKSQYPGPYTATPKQQAMFDKAVECSPDDRTVTFHLNRPIADFNNAVALGMSPVPKSADTGETYGIDKPPVSSGPYEVQSYAPGEAGTLILVRNGHWDPASDPVRKAYPDRWQVELGIDQAVIDRRLMAADGEDAFALQYGPTLAADLPTIFSDSHTPNTNYAGRAVSGFDPYVRYLWINVAKVPSVKVRQAMMVALDREAFQTARGGPFFGTLADGVLKPTIGLDYAPTGIWDTFFGEPVPPSGDPELAKRLIAESGVVAPRLTYTYPDTPSSKKASDVVVASLAKAGIVVEAVPICFGYGCGIVASLRGSADFGPSGWGADWPGAASVIPPMFTEAGGWDLSNVQDIGYATEIRKAEATLDPLARASKWQALNKEAVEKAWVIPTFFGLSQTLAGTNVGPVYRWPAYQSWPYGVMSVTP
jgi:peptide/nickel transport system substrate-binding protein